MDIRCTCGATHTLPDTFRGDHVRCRSCDAIVPVGNAAAIPVARLAERSKLVPALLIAGVIVLGLGAVVAATWYFGRSTRYTPTQAESVEEKYRSASQSFTGPAAVIDPKSDEGKVAACLDALTEAQRTGQGEKFLSLLHVRRLLAEAERGGGLPGLRNQRQEDEYIKGLKQGMSTSISQNARNQLLHWKSIRIFRVTFQPERGEAQVFCSLRLGMGVSAKFRFWLIKEGDSWRVFDWESMEEGLRTSVLLSTMMAGAGNQPQRANQIAQVGPAMQQAILKLNEGDLAGAKAAVDKARKLSPPEALLALLDVLDSSLLAAEGKHEEALRMLDSALARNSDLPVAHHLKANCYGALEKYEDCVREELEYLRMVGDDPEVYASLGGAYEGLGKKGEAVEAYRKGIACGEEDFDNRYNLAQILLEEGKVDEAKKLFLESCANAPEPTSYVEGAARLLYDADAVEPLLELCLAWPDGVASHFYRGHALRRLGRHAEAEKTLSEGLPKADDDWRALFHEELAFALGHLGNIEKALECASKLGDEKDSRVGYARAYVHAAGGDHAKAADLLVALLVGDRWWASAVEKEPVFAEALKVPACRDALALAGELQAFPQEAAQLVESGDAAALLARADRHLAIAPDDMQGHYFRGFALLRLGRYEESEKALLTGVARDQEWRRSQYWRHLACACARLGRRDDALTHAAKLQGAEAAYARACIEAVIGKQEEAVRELTRALRTGPYLHADARRDAELEGLRASPSMQALLDRAKTCAAFQEEAGELSEAEDYDAMLALAEKHLHDVQDDANGWYFKGQALRMLDRHAEAEVALRAGLEMDESDQHPHYWIELAHALVGRGRYDEALEMAARLEGDPAWKQNGLYTRAFVLVSWGRVDQAVEALRALLEQAPSWRFSIEGEPIFADIVKRADVQEMLKKAKGE